MPVFLLPLSPIVAGAAVGATVLISGGIYYYTNDKLDGWFEAGEEEAQKTIEAGASFLGEVAEGIGAGLETIGEGLGELGEDLGAGALVVIRGAGRAIIDSGENMFDYIAKKVSPHRVEAVTAITAMLFYGATAVIVFKKIRGVN